MNYVVRMPTPAKLAQRKALVQLLCDARDQGKIGMLAHVGGYTQYLGNYKAMERAFLSMVASDSADEWPHFINIEALPEVIRAYRQLPDQGE